MIGNSAIHSDNTVGGGRRTDRLKRDERVGPDGVDAEQDVQSPRRAPRALRPARARQQPAQSEPDPGAVVQEGEQVELKGAGAAEGRWAWARAQKRVDTQHARQRLQQLPDQQPQRVAGADPDRGGGADAGEGERGARRVDETGRERLHQPHRPGVRPRRLGQHGRTPGRACAGSAGGSRAAAVLRGWGERRGRVAGRRVPARLLVLLPHRQVVEGRDLEHLSQSGRHRANRIRSQKR
eukprot:scaffold12197_cov90-Isochrysis_galbana.AAC.2